MKKSTKIALFVALACIVIGGAVVGATAAVGGGFEDMWRRAYDEFYRESVYDSSMDGVSLLQVAEGSAYVELTRSWDDELHVTYRESKYVDYVITEKNGVLQISCEREEEPRRMWYEWVQFSMEVDMGRALEIAIPDGYRGGVEIVTENGAVDAHGLSFEKSISVETGNGAVWLNSVACSGAVSVKAANARLAAEELSAESASFGTENGSIELEDCSVRTELKAETRNGRISLSDAAAGESILLRTENGEITGSIVGSKDDFSIESRTTNGSSNLPERTSGGEKKLSAVTSNAEIYIRFTR